MKIKRKKKEEIEDELEEELLEREGKEKKGKSLNPEIKFSLWAIFYFVLGMIFIFSYFNLAGPIGRIIFRIFSFLLGVGYFLLPGLCFILTFDYFWSINKKIKFNNLTLLGAFFVLLSSLSLIEINFQQKAGFIGYIGSLLKYPFGFWPTLIIYLALFLAGGVLIFNTPLKIKVPFLFKKEEKLEEFKGVEELQEVKIEEPSIPKELKEEVFVEEKQLKDLQKEEEFIKEKPFPKKKISFQYRFPPLSLFYTDSKKPLAGDIKANANIIKRTLESFGIEVEMGEVNVGPTVTQYTLKPAEGVKLSSITTLQSNLALALAAHPLRIEAPIPGKSLVGIEVPNRSIALVRLGSIFKETNFLNTPPLVFALGRDVKGEAMLANLEKMPHLLIAGSTGSGKSVCIHSILCSFLVKNSPSTLRLILVDPKRVELARYNSIPHLLSPVIIENKKVLPALKWVIQEMERRYDLLSKYSARDIVSYNQKVEKKGEEPLPYIVVIIDELADLMIHYGKDLETLIIRIAQMARATGIHLIVSTQRPSVEVITGLIKANITTRIAFQVASQVDSRTILDISGAEKLLGHGDMLFLSSDFLKPRRIQGAYVSEEEVNQLIDFISQNKKPEDEGINLLEEGENQGLGVINFDEISSEPDDELYEEAYKVVVQMQKASASLLQRRLRIGYARAARLLDLLEERGVIGPADGAKPREVFIKEEKNFSS
ncbi:MAG: DNA translocase FtsK [Minisyncoccia bacterium]